MAHTISPQLLVVEDDGGLNTLIQKRLKQEGFSITGVVNGTDALDMVEQNSALVLLLDYYLPDISVMTIIERLKQSGSQVPFIIMTGDGDEKIAVEMMKLGAMDYIVKDTNFLDLLPTVVRRVVDEIDTKQKLAEAEKAFRDTNQILGSVIKASPLAIISLDNEAQVLLWSAAAERMFGWKEHEVKNSPLPIVPQTMLGDFRIMLQSIISNKSCMMRELRCLCKDGEMIDVSISIAPLFGDAGDVQGTMGIIENITQQKKTDLEKKQLEAQLQQTQKLDAIGTLAAGVAHDFNNILTTVQGYSDLMLMKMDEADPLYRDINQVRTAAGRGAALVRQLLIFSRKQPMEFRYIDLNRVIDDLLKMLYRLIGEDIKINTDISPELWTTKADEGKIEQIIMNLAVNAKEAMPDGGSITISTENKQIDTDACRLLPDARPGKFSCFSVCDNGYGIEQDILNRIFDPFFTTRRSSGGTGLGLATVYGIVKNHKGWIQVESKQGQGTKFSVYLPASNHKPDEKTDERLSIEHFQGCGEKILLVEDEEAIREIAVTILRDRGYEVHEAEDFDMAINIVERSSERFDMILSDVVLPGKSGIQLVDQLLAQDPQLKVVLCSGYTDEKSQWPIIQQRGYAFIEKPYTMVSLLKTIQDVMRSQT
ncbi:response regulator [Thermodesulfobacteriota bacterium]